MRAVLDPNVIISGLLSSRGAPAALLSGWAAGAYELVVSAKLLGELQRVLTHPKLRRRIEAHDAVAVVAWLQGSAVLADDREHPPLAVRSRDPNDDYLLALAAAEHALLVTGDAYLLELDERLPIHTPRSFLASLHT